ncbi:MAG: sigma-54 dependent transcriptional regulator, partial [Candidatus Cloacimonadaceae bacterium]|nr:sigma-54 dependent transcriptional regulator [Candidatus Cloacimonadaceae bacterium]
IVLTDFKMPKLTGLDLIRHIKDHTAHIRVIMITGYPTIEGAVEAVKLGAEEYLTKPFTDDELFRSIDKAVDKIRHHKISVKPSITNTNPYGIIGISPAIQKVYHLIQKSCTNNATVLIEGESGTGKELVARAIHYHSKREISPFVPVNCAAIPETLLESELFGYMKGSFTGANETRAGYFITADGGTIFLDEIGETSLSMQVKLLRVLQDKQVFMIGAKSPRKVNLRIITATNKDLKLLINQGSFREDLYYRLNVLSIPIPPLRERRDDIVPLTYFFLDKFSRENSQKAPQIGDEVLATLQDYHWPGNVRELENLIYRLVIMNEGQTISNSELPEYMKFTIRPHKKLNRTLSEVEWEHIDAVLRSVDGNKTQAAAILGIDRKTLHNKLTRT